MNETDIINTPWRDRGYLPHLEHQKVQVLTFRLYDSVPSRIIDEWKSQLAEESETSSKSDLIKQIKKQIDQYEDSGHGQCFLRNKDVAKVMEDTLLYGNGKIYKLISWCVMPNHVHVMIEILNDTPV